MVVTEETEKEHPFFFDFDCNLDMEFVTEEYCESPKSLMIEQVRS